VQLVLADNDEGALALIDLDLRLEGHQVVGLASDGAEAVALCAALRPEVLVVDYRMPPGIDGVEVARQVLAAGDVDRVVIYSNYRDPAVLARAEAVGATWVSKGRLAALRAELS
jgi:DNA-binding NarL/FixJ family response regulator